MDVVKIALGILDKVDKLLYIKYERDNVSRLTLAFEDEQALTVEQFLDEAECNLVWDVLVHFLTSACVPPFVQIQTVLFQPTIVSQIATFSEERGYFVLLDFKGKHNIGLGFSDKEERDQSYQNLIEYFKVIQKEKESSPTLH